MGNSSHRGHGARPPPLLRLIVDEHLGAIRSYLIVLGVPSRDLDDVVQEVLDGADRASERYDPGCGDLRSWLRGIAFRQAVNYLRRSYHRHELLCATEELEALKDDAPDSAQQLIDARRRRQVHEIVSEIAPERREVFVAFEIEQTPMKQISEDLSIPMTTGWSRLRSAREEFAAAVQRKRAQDGEHAFALLPLLLDALSFGHGRALLASLERLRGAVREASSGDAALPSQGAGRPMGRQSWNLFASPAVHPIVGAACIGLMVEGHGRSDDGTAFRVEAPPGEAVFASHVAHVAPRAVPPASGTTSSVAATAAALGARVGSPAADQTGTLRPGRTVEEERKLIQHATAALFAGELREAALALERHEREFPAGRQVGTRKALLARLRARTVGSR